MLHANVMALCFMAFVDILLPFICAMCNASLRERVLPVSQKTAIIAPAMQKRGLDPDELQTDLQLDVYVEDYRANRG